MADQRLFDHDDDSEWRSAAYDASNDGISYHAKDDRTSAGLNFVGIMVEASNYDDAAGMTWDGNGPQTSDLFAAQENGSNLRDRNPSHITMPAAPDHFHDSASDHKEHPLESVMPEQNYHSRETLNRRFQAPEFSHTIDVSAVLHNSFTTTNPAPVRNQFDEIVGMMDDDGEGDGENIAGSKLIVSRENLGELTQLVKQHNVSNKYRTKTAAETGVLGPLSRPQIQQDDWKNVEAAFESYHARLFDALAQTHAAPPVYWMDDKKDFYHRGQSNAKIIIANLTSSVERFERAEALTSLAIHQAIEAHKFGIPDRFSKDFEDFHTGFKPATELSCLERVERIIESVTMNKFVALDLLENKLDALVYDPVGCRERKLANIGTNSKKRKILTEVQQEAKKVKVTVETEAKKHSDGQPKKKPDRMTRTPAKLAPDNHATIPSSRVNSKFKYRALSNRPKLGSNFPPTLPADSGSSWQSSYQDTRAEDNDVGAPSQGGLLPQSRMGSGTEDFNKQAWERSLASTPLNSNVSNVEGEPRFSRPIGPPQSSFEPSYQTRSFPPASYGFLPNQTLHENPQQHPRRMAELLQHGSSLSPRYLIQNLPPAPQISSNHFYEGGRLRVELQDVALQSRSSVQYGQDHGGQVGFTPKFTQQNFIPHSFASYGTIESSEPFWASAQLPKFPVPGPQQTLFDLESHQLASQAGHYPSSGTLFDNPFSLHPNNSGPQPVNQNQMMAGDADYYDEQEMPAPSTEEYGELSISDDPGCFEGSIF